LTVKRAPRKHRGEGEDSLIAFCRALPGATEDVKWGKDLIFSVGGKMFAGFELPEGEPLAFKVDPLDFDGPIVQKGIVPAPHMAHHSWVSVPERRRYPPHRSRSFSPNPIAWWRRSFRRRRAMPWASRHSHRRGHFR
jgi:predicted DNA-binding protein (MmcQ/YjbR family)